MEPLEYDEVELEPYDEVEPLEYDEPEPTEVTPAEDPLIEVSPTFDDEIDDGETGELPLVVDVPPDIEADSEPVDADVPVEAEEAEAEVERDLDAYVELDAAAEGATEASWRAARCCEREPWAGSGIVLGDAAREDPDVTSDDPGQDSVDGCPASRSSLSGSAWSPQRSTRLVMPR